MKTRSGPTQNATKRSLRNGSSGTPALSRRVVPIEDLGGYAIWGVYDLGRGVNDPRGYKYWVYKI